MGQYVALLDILGFKDIINNNPHEEVVDLFKHFRIYVQMGLAKNKTTEGLNGRLTYDVRASTLNSNIISDSLIFWTNDNKASGLFEVIDCLHIFTTFCHNLPHIFLRGGITYGDYYYENNGIIRGKDTFIIHPIMVGKGLVDVYEIEKQLQIAGCIITENAIEEAKGDGTSFFADNWDMFIDEKKIVKYEMPTKKGKMDSWTINWVRDLDRSDFKEIKDGFSSFNKRIDDVSVQEKIENTMAYFLYVKEHVYKKRVGN